MEEASLHEILEELNITSLDESDLEVAGPGLESFSVDGSDRSALSHGLQGGGLSLGEETSSDSAALADVNAALESPRGSGLVLPGASDGISELESRLRLGVFPSCDPLGSGTRGLAAAVQAPRQLSAVDAQHELTRAVYSLGQEQAEQVHQLERLRRDMEMQRSLDALATAKAAAVPEESVALAAASRVFRLQMSDLTISEAQYQALRARPEEELNVREWVQLRFREARDVHRAEVERLRLEVEALRENAYEAQTRSESFERQFRQRDAVASDLAKELEACQRQTRVVRDGLTRDLRAAEKRLADVADKEQRFDSLFEEAGRMRQEVKSLVEAMALESSQQQKMVKEHADTIERLHELETAHRLLKKDAEAHERRARLLEETLARKDEDNAELRSKVESLREKKRELAKKAAAEQVGITQEARERVDVEIARLRERSEADLEAVRNNLNSLHAKEVILLTERYEASQARAVEIQRRLDDEEHAHQALQMSSNRIRAELQNEITELSGALKLRAFESERSTLTQEELSVARQQLEVQNEQLKQQVEVLRKEYYNLEVEHREGRAADRAELTSLREQLKGYSEVEKELDAAIRACADGKPRTDTGGQAEPQPQSVDEALLLGTTLASAPTSSQRRIQQSLLLAQELQRRTRELSAARVALTKADEDVDRLRQDLEVTRKELSYSSEPQAYLLEALRRREHEVMELNRRVRSQEVDLERSRQQVESAMAKRLDTEEDLKQLLCQREHLDSLCAVLGSGAMSEGGPVQSAFAPLASAAEHRGRAPNQQRAQPGDGHRAWFQRLKSKAAATEGGA
eukprot:TRINITY_DN101266_c0_g1_i1.p1 TRINITY_DN101266_c0_g1~~TRINITY_DN101266_c0_g1_i1.p1  ORF type:complete len:810 (-),score=185.81 TRINITY_DN101266_c0_g1_i1:220-2649(-)